MKFPDMRMENVINYPNEFITTDDFKGKVLLLDFWNTRCTACFKLFPKLDSLQRLFNDKIQIVLVNVESKEVTEAFFATHKKIFKPNLPMVTNGKSILDLFPVEGYPYTVWINDKGDIKHFSEGHSITQDNLLNFLLNKDLALTDPTKVRYGSPIDKSKFEFFSTIAHCSDSINVGNTGLLQVKDGKGVSIARNCSSIKDLYVHAYSENGRYDFSGSYGLVLDVRDKFEYEFPGNEDWLDEWLREHAYTYELMLPADKEKLAYKFMQQDLERYFGLKVKVEGRKVNSLVLTRVKDLKVSPVSKVVNSNADSVLCFRDVPFQRFVRELKLLVRKKYPISDESGFSGKVSCCIRYSSFDPVNFFSLQSDLRKSGFELTVAKRQIPVLIISDGK